MNWKRLQLFGCVKANRKKFKRKKRGWKARIERKKQGAFERRLQSFKDEYKLKSNEEKIKKLQWWTTLKFKNLQSYSSVRQEHDKSKWRWFQAWRKCWVCMVAPTQLIHHIVMVSNGGTNDMENLMSLCHKCHAEIHPWLKEKIA